jgi:hypothetical protein
MICNFPLLNNIYATFLKCTIVYDDVYGIMYICLYGTSIRYINILPQKVKWTSKFWGM